MSVSIVTDTVACLPDSVVRQCHISVVPMEIVYKGKVYKDGVDMSPQQFYELLACADVLPTTSAPTPKAYLDVYEGLLKAGQEILVVCPSTRLTHVFSSATIGAQMVKEKFPNAVINVLDSGTAASAQGFVVLDGASAAAGDNLGLAEVTRIVQDAMKEVHVLVFFETIDYLARGGRVPYILAWATSLLKIKPVVELLPLGKGVIPVDRVRTREKALVKVMDILEKRLKGRRARVAVQHTNSLAEATQLADMVRARLGCQDVWIQDFTPVMGVHTGPGLLGVSYSTYVPAIEK